MPEVVLERAPSIGRLSAVSGYTSEATMVTVSAGSSRDGSPTLGRFQMSLASGDHLLSCGSLACLPASGNQKNLNVWATFDN